MPNRQHFAIPLALFGVVCKEPSAARILCCFSWCAQANPRCGALHTQARPYTSIASTTHSAPQRSVSEPKFTHLPVPVTHVYVIGQQSHPSGYGQSRHAYSTSSTSKGTLLENQVPTWLLPYVHLSRLHKPIGTWLLAWPSFWTIGMAATPGHLPDLYTLGLFGAGAVVCSLLLFLYFCLPLSAGLDGKP